MKIQMIETDERGETHFGACDMPDRELAFGPPPNPAGQMSGCGAVTNMFVTSFPAGTEAPPLNAPQSHIAIVLSGEGVVVTSDGDARRFHPDEILFCDDLAGNGHVTRAITELISAFLSPAR